MNNLEKETSLGRRDFAKLLVATGAASIACNFPLRIVFDRKTSQGKDRLFLKPSEIGAESPENLPTEFPEPTPEPTPDTRSLFEKYVYPALKEVAGRRREQKAIEDSGFWNRVDKELNENRVNFALLGIGSEKILTDSIQIMSLGLNNNEVRTISLQRDTLAPEISRYKNSNNTYRINQAHILGGMPLTEKILEDATGLSADFVVVMHMDVLPRAVKKVFGNQLEVCIPWVIDDKMMGSFPAGLQTLDGDEVLRASRARYYASNRQRNIVQQYVLRAMLRRVRTDLSEGPLGALDLMRKSLLFYESETKSGAIKTNFDSGLFLSLGANILKQISTGGSGEEASGFGLPTFSARYSVSVENAGGYKKKPLGGNPGARDLVNGYWFSSRSEIKEFLHTPTENLGFELEAELCGIDE